MSNEWQVTGSQTTKYDEAVFLHSLFSHQLTPAK